MASVSHELLLFHPQGSPQQSTATEPDVTCQTTGYFRNREPGYLLMALESRRERTRNLLPPPRQVFGGHENSDAVWRSLRRYVTGQSDRFTAAARSRCHPQLGLSRPFGAIKPDCLWALWRRLRPLGERCMELQMIAPPQLCPE